jgi:serine phosphatase RsbU (regulator of sigma subunit)
MLLALSHPKIPFADREVRFRTKWSDIGLTEAMNSDEQEFGELKLVELGSRHMASSASELLAAIKRELVSFCNGDFQDDFTLVVVAVKSVRSG